MLKILDKLIDFNRESLWVWYTTVYKSHFNTWMTMYTFVCDLGVQQVFDAIAGDFRSRSYLIFLIS